MRTDKKIKKSLKLIAKMTGKIRPENICIEWTGGKYSTLMLWMYRTVCQENCWGMPVCIFIDNGDIFDEVREFVYKLGKQWGVNFKTLENSDVISKIKSVGDSIEVKSLNETNQAGLNSIGYQDEDLIYDPESEEGKYLLRTVLIDRFIKANEFKGLSVAIRSENSIFGRRAKDFELIKKDFLSYMEIRPIMNFSEKEVWEAIHTNNIPYCDLYEKGFRSLDSRYYSAKSSSLPAWQQDFEATPERVTRRGDDVIIMKRLKSLGYL